MIGLMGAGKTRVGKRVAERLGLPFVDADHEIERETGKTISELFQTIGESAFRDGERRTIARLLAGPLSVIAAGGGAYMDAATRDEIRRRGISVWLRADLDVLVARTSRSNRRPLLEGVDRRAKLAELIAQRYPVYESADVTVESLDVPVDRTAEAAIDAVALFLKSRASAGEGA